MAKPVTTTGMRNPVHAPIVLSPDLVALLQTMGLTWDEVRIYQFLLNASPAISSAIVRETGHPRGRIYDTLRHLVEKGLVHEEPTRPIQFHPTPLAQTLAKARAHLSKQLEMVKAEEGAAERAHDPEAEDPPLPPTKARDVRVLSGRRACHTEWSRMLSEAEEYFWLTGGENLANRLARMPGFLRELRAAHDKGLNVHVLLPQNGATESALGSMAPMLGHDVLYTATIGPLGPLVSCATDQASMDVISQPDDDALNRGDDVGVQIASEVFADASRSRRDLLEALKPGDPSVPYQWLGPNHGPDLFLDAIRGAKSEVLVLGPAEWSRYLARDWQQNAAMYSEAKERGVRFRALTVGGPEDLGALEAFAHVWDIRVVDRQPLWLTIIDGRLLYQAFTHDSIGGPPQFRQSREPHEITFYAAVFARLWAEGEAA